MNKYGQNADNNDSLFDNGDGSNVTAGWTEIDLSEVMKRPCFAYKRGNIVFTTIPPSRDEKRARSALSGTSVDNRCRVKVTNYDNSAPRPQTRTDFCEVCCGIRSPSFSRRAHSFTTHFCTRVPAKGNNVSSLSPFTQQRADAAAAAATVTADSIVDSSSTISSLANSYRNPPKVSRPFGTRVCVRYSPAITAIPFCFRNFRLFSRKWRRLLELHYVQI